MFIYYICIIYDIWCIYKWGRYKVYLERYRYITDIVVYIRYRYIRDIL